MPRPLKQGLLGASTIILSKDIDKYAFMCGSNFNETDITISLALISYIAQMLGFIGLTIGSCCYIYYTFRYIPVGKLTFNLPNKCVGLYFPIDLHLIFETSSLKNRVGRTISSLNFAGDTGSKNQV